jgi:hypothetical protein
MKKISLAQPVVEEMMSILRSTIVNGSGDNDLYIQQRTMLEMLQCGLDSAPVELNLKSVMSMLDQHSITPEQFKAVEMWLIDPRNHIPERTSKQFLGNMEGKIKHA